MSARPPSEPRAGIGEWPVWGDEPPELRFRQIPSTPVHAPAASLPPPPAADMGPQPPRLAVPGFILGLLGACLGWVPVAGLGCGLFGAVLSMQARRAIPPGHRGRVMPTAGLVLGCIGVAFGVFTSAIAVTIGLNALFGALYGG